MPNDRLGTSYTDADALRDVFGGSSSGGSTGVYSDIDALRDVFGPQYVAGGPGGIPGAKDVPGQSLSLSPEVQIKQFRALIAGQGGDLSGKSDAEVSMLMHRFNTTGGQEMTDYQPEKTRAGEFGRGLRRGVAYGLPLGIPGVEAMRENEQVQRAPEGVAGFAGETLGGFAGMLNPEQAPANALAIALTGGMGRAIAPVVGRVGEIAGPRVARAVQEAIINAGQGGGIAALQEAGRITPQEWAEDPAGSLLRVGKAAGIGAGAGGALGGGIGALGKAPVDYPAGTLPETLAPQTAADGRAAMAEQGQAAMRDVADVYRGAPRANEIDPAVLAARNAADAQARAQAEASARAYDAEMMGAADIARRRAAASAAESAKIIENAPEPARVETPETQIGANREEAQGQAQGNQEGLLSPGKRASSKTGPSGIASQAVDSISYDELVRRAKAAGVYRDGPKTRAALVERVSAAETRSAQGTPTPESPEPASAGRASAALPEKTAPAQSDLGSSPDPTRQPWEMTREEVYGNLTGEEVRAIDRAMTPVEKRILLERGIDRSTVEKDQASRRGMSGAEYRSIIDDARRQAFYEVDPHASAVRNALREGRPVPPEVLKDYPDLAKSARRTGDSTNETAGVLAQADVGANRGNVGPTGVDRRFVSPEPNRKGTPRERLSEDFIKEFGDSKVVDGDGNPLPVYHGTRSAFNPREMYTPAYFSNAPRSTYAGGEGGRHFAAYLRMKNPKEYGGPPMTVRHSEVVQAIKDGYDGFIQRSHDRVDYIVFNKDQVIPADGSDIPISSERAKPPTPAEAGTTPAGTAAGQVEAPKASGKPTAQQIIAESSDKRSALQSILDQEDGPALWSDHQLIRPNGKYEIKDGKLVKVQDLSKTGFEKNLRDHIDAGEPGRWWNANRSALERMDQIRAEDEAKASAIQESRRIEREKQIAESNRQAEYRSELEAEVSGSRFSRKDVDVTFNDPNEPKKTVKMQVFGGIGVWKDPDGGYVATHVSSGKRLFTFDSLGKAKAFAVRASKIVDFSKSAEELVKSTDQYTYGLLSDAARDPFEPPSTYKPIDDYPGTGQGTAPKEGTAGTAAIPPPQEPRATEPQPPEVRAKAETEQTANRLPPEGVKAPEPAKESPVPDSQQDASGSSSPDFTARRVVDQPEPGEPEGLYTSAKNAVTEEKRTKLGLKAYDGPERRSWGAAMDTAVAKGIPERSLDIASSVIAKPRQLSDIEQAGMVRRLMDLEIKDRDIRAKIAQTTDNAELLALAAEGERNLAEFDTITTGINKGGTEIGRALAIRKMMLAEDYSIMAVKTKARANAAKAGHSLTPDQLKEFEAMADRFEGMTKRMEEAVGKLEAERAESTLKRHAASKRGVDPKVREQNIATLAEKARTLLSQGCR